MPPHRRLRLPRPLTPFVGRERELADLERRLADPACRVLTLIGPGGFGKTRLALQLGAGWPEDVLYVDLQARPGPRPLAADIADAGRHPPPAGVTLEEHLLQDLRERRCLVVLDGFERLLDHHPAAEPFAFLERLLEAAPGVKLLVASREALSLLGEWRYPVSGLASPPPDMDPRQPAAMEFEAVRLFVQAAQRVRPDFSPEDEAAGIIRLCQLVEGMPLALELAAAWTTTLTCAAIADEIAGGAELGHAGLRNLPAQHHSVQAVFRQAWERLAPEEQQVFRRLAVFRPGFSPAAAAAVAEATRPRLGALLDKAMLRRDAQGRYALHELLRQFAEERLAEAAETDRFQARHAEYYAECLRQWRADLKGGRQAEAVRRIATEIDNIRAAWDWLV
ncbi:MAG: AAA family ATPase, partial [Anaerolineales bacterium]|nr:AAA family ATPase [Anaerolineales bacterium]